MKWLVGIRKYGNVEFRLQLHAPAVMSRGKFVKSDFETTLLYMWLSRKCKHENLIKSSDFFIRGNHIDFMFASPELKFGTVVAYMSQI